MTAPRGLAGPLSLPGVESGLWVSPALVRHRVGAWLYGQAGGSIRTRGSVGPATSTLRRVVAVAEALAETAHSLWVPSAARLSELDLPAADRDVARRSGLSVRDVAAARALLMDAGVVRFVAGTAAAPVVRLSPDVLEPMPTVPRLAWDVVRERLEVSGVAAAAPVAVLRELARLTGPVADATRAPAVRCSVRELEAATAYGRSTVSGALAALEAAGLVTLEARRGQTMRCTLGPPGFGLPGAAPRAAPSRALPSEAAETDGAEEAPPGPAVVRQGPSPARAGPPDMGASPGAGAAVVRLGEFAGTPIFAPSGTPVVVEQDAEGRWVCRVGPFLRLGPAGP